MPAPHVKSEIWPLRQRALPDRGPAAGASRRLEVWLAPPNAADHVDADQLSESQKLKLERLRQSSSREEFLVSRALQQRLSARSANQSLAHSAGHAVVACAPIGPRIGVDLERHRPRDVGSLARFAFANDEYLALMDLSPARRLERFYMLWVMKEAMAKALQVPLIDALGHCIFTERSRGEWHGRAPTDEPWRIIVFAPREQLSLAVAIIGDEPLPLDTYEWPPHREAQWTVVATLGRSG